MARQLIRAVAERLPSLGFANVAEAYVFFDADGQGEISLFELRRGLHLLGPIKDPRDPGTPMDARALLFQLDPLNRGAGLLTLDEFARNFGFGKRPTSTAELEAWVAEAKCKRRTIVARVQKTVTALSDPSGQGVKRAKAAARQQQRKMNAKGAAALSSLRAALQECGFHDPAQAFAFFDTHDSGLITNTQLKVGLRRLQLDHLLGNDELAWALEGGGMRDNRVMFSEWMRNVGWGEFGGPTSASAIVAQNAALDAAMLVQNATTRRVLARAQSRKKKMQRQADSERAAAVVAGVAELPLNSAWAGGSGMSVMTRAADGSVVFTPNEQLPSTSSGVNKAASQGRTSGTGHQRANAPPNLIREEALPMGFHPEPVEYLWTPDPSYREPAAAATTGGSGRMDYTATSFDGGGSGGAVRSRPLSATVTGSISAGHAKSGSSSGGAGRRRQRPRSALASTSSTISMT